MGKKRLRKKVVSKGIHGSIRSAVATAARASRDAVTLVGMKSRAWKLGQNPWLTVANPNKGETNKLFIRVRANDYWGSPKAHWTMKQEVAD